MSQCPLLPVPLLPPLPLAQFRNSKRIPLCPGWQFSQPSPQIYQGCQENQTLAPHALQ